MYIRKIKICEDSVEKIPTEEKLKSIADNIKQQLKLVGVYSCIEITSKSAIKITECRLTDEYMKEYGRNQSPYSNKTCGILGWEDWVVVNNTINETLDKFNVSAIATSLGKAIEVRNGRQYDRDYSHAEYANVGSQINVVYRKDAWSSNGRGRDGWKDDLLIKSNIATKKDTIVDGIITKINHDVSLDDLDLGYIKFLGGVRDVFINECHKKDTRISEKSLEQINALFQVQVKHRKNQKNPPLEVAL